MPNYTAKEQRELKGYMRRVKSILSAGRIWYPNIGVRKQIDMFCMEMGVPSPSGIDHLTFLRQYFKKSKKPKRVFTRNENGDTTYSFYASIEWVELKKAVLRLYGNTCMRCGVKHTVMHVDHIVPRSWAKSRELDITNLQVLCKSCNEEKG